MIAFHIFMAVLAVWRITEAVTQDVIFKTPREWWLKRFEGKHYANFLTCPRCVSAWAGLFSAAMFYLAPFVNWPFGLSMTYLFWLTLMEHVNFSRQRKIIIMPDINRIEFGVYSEPQAFGILRQVLKESVPPQNQKAQSVISGNGKR